MKSDGISEFMGVVTAGSFSGAARNLKVSVAHVSRRVAALEECLGVKLLVRSTRSLNLTEIGQSFFERCSSISSDLDEAIQMTATLAQNIEGRIRITTLSGSFSDLVVAPTLARFAKEHPGVELDVDYSPRRVDLIREGFDFAIRSGSLDDSDLIVKPIARRTTVAAASYEYLEKFGEPKHPSELKNHSCILTGSKVWRFLQDGKDVKVNVKGRIAANSGDALREACERGIGIAYMASSGYGTAISECRLKPILRNYWNDRTTISLLYPDKHFLPRRVELAMKAIQLAAKQAEMQEQAFIKTIRN